MNSEDRLLIVHCDDMGSSWGANEAGKMLLKRGIAKSASIMIPCPWAYEFVRWSVDNPGFDIGIHLTLNSEWDCYRWGPVAGKSVVPSLCDKNGFFYRQHVDTADPQEVRLELEAQIMTALNWGLKPTHLDIHMWMLYSKPEYYRVFLNLARDYRIVPILLEDCRPHAASLIKEADLPVLSGCVGARGADSYEMMKQQIYDQIRTIVPGCTYYIIHPNLGTPDMPAITPWDWQNREWNYMVFMDDDTKKFLEDENIKVTTWSELSNRCGCKW